MRIAIDAMGGDQAPGKILQGAVQALELLDPGDELVLVGTESVIRETIPAELAAHANLRIEPSTQVITMDDSPAKAIRGKPNSSIVRMVKLARAGQVDAVISAGNTGALVAAGVLMLKTLPGVDRPGLACLMPSVKGGVVLCDAGANTQPEVEHLYQYAVMAGYYTQATRGIEKPTVGILNIGTEEEKGTPLVKATRERFLADPELNFVGYVEARDIPNHPCDVVVTDGFTGNMVLKTAEGFSTIVLKLLQKEAMADGPETIEKLKPAMGRVLKQFDHEEYGGALLLGVSGLFFKVHGAGGPRAIKNAVAKAKAAGRLDIGQKITARLAKS